MADGEPPAAPEQRRGSMGRALSKIKDAVKRRSANFGSARKSIAEDPAANPHKPAEPPAEGTTKPDETTTTPATAEQTALPDAAPKADDSAKPADAAVHSPPVLIDASEPIEVGDEDEAWTGTTSVTSKLRSVRAKAVFDRYGILYEEDPKELPGGGRHIQKAIRIRIHWECHNCHNTFGSSKTCTRCGHKRCSECARTPTKRVKELLGGTAAMQEIEKKAAKSSTDTDSILVPVVIGTEASPDAAVVPAVAGESTGASPASHILGAASLPLEADTLARDGDVVVTLPQYTRSRPTIQLRLRHKEASTSDGVLRELHPGEEGARERVYRKPRQRVRWTCDSCHTMFLSGRSCLNCGHQRCDTCTRSPLKKAPRGDVDPAILAAVAERLAPKHSISTNISPAVVAAG